MLLPLVLALLLTLCAPRFAAAANSTSSTLLSGGGSTVPQLSWPPSQPPFVDKCAEKAASSCAIFSNSTNVCVWASQPYPSCFNQVYLGLSPSPRVNVAPELSLALKFFAHSFGMYLCEGTFKQTLYNTDLDECAQLCIQSGLHGRRCLSFNWFPFEDPYWSAPWLEDASRGVCVLNSGNKDTARLRNEDEGNSDAELFYVSHYSNRPVSAASGYYELKDPRGGQIGQLLEGDPDPKDVATINLWPMSRWGLAHFRIPKTAAVDCTAATVGPLPPALLGFSGGFTPTDDMGHCPGLMTKDAALRGCRNAGGRLCSRTELSQLNGLKLGCSLDSFALWANEDVPSTPTQTRYSRCCADYMDSADCTAYSSARIARCVSLTSVSDCVQKGSGTSAQAKLGFGNALLQYRQQCAANQTLCRSALAQDWAPRDACVWCLTPLGNGECRPGGDFGICPRASSAARMLFATKLVSQCGSSPMCAVAKLFPDW